MANQPSSKLFKIRLVGGRVLGPLDLDRVRALIIAGRINGREQGREHPGGEWREISQIEPIAELLLLAAQGALAATAGARSEVEPEVDLGAATRIMSPTRPVAPPKPEPPSEQEPAPEDATVFAARPDGAGEGAGEGAAEDVTRVVSSVGQQSSIPLELEEGQSAPAVSTSRNITNEKTVLFRRSVTAQGGGQGGLSLRQRPWVKQVILLGAATVMLLEAILGGDSTNSSRISAPTRIRPRLPGVAEREGSPVKSEELYRQALAFYQEDTIPGYRQAVDLFHRALQQDGENVRALAMLASAYLNLIDVSNKDENYFSVISKLVELSRAKNLDLAETLIAESEYLILTGRPLAAETRLIEHSKVNRNYSETLKLYLVLAFLARGENARAAQYVVPIQTLGGLDARLRFVRGQVAEAMGDLDAAMTEYRSVLKKSPRHAMSRFRIARIADQRGELKTVRDELLRITRTADQLPSRQLAEAYAMRSRLDQLDGRIDVALGNMERALRLEPENPDYNLNYFVLRARAGDSLPEVRKEARLYYYMAESERLLRLGKVDEAMLQLMDARKEAPRNPQPLVRMGNLFYLHKSDVLNARISLKKAAQLAPGDVRILGRYVELLIQSYEWEEANRALARLRALPVQQSAVDKAMADWYAKQGRHQEAQQFYKKALSHDYIDPSVYIAFGKSLLETRNYEQAPFAFALALRNDPNSTEALVGTARAIQGAEGVDRAVSYLRDELQKGGATRVELLSAIAELLVQKGAWEEAMSFVEQAREAAPASALPYRAQAMLHAARPNALRNGGDRGAKERVLESYKAYLDRNPSDAAIIFEKYRVLLELSEFEQADLELQKIYELYPKFPNLHASKALIYVRLGNFKAAQTEYEEEMRNGNNSVPVLLALGRVHVELKEPETALKYFIQAMQRAPREAEPKHMVAHANFMLRKYDAAIALFREALKLDSGNPIIYRRLGEAYRAMGDAQGARWAFQKYLEMEPDAADRAELQRY